MHRISQFYYEFDIGLALNGQTKLSSAMIDAWILIQF